MDIPARTANYLALGMLLALFVACANQMEPARQALAGIDNVVTAASPDASQYAPSQLVNVQSELSNLKASFANKDYAVVVARAPAVLSDAQSMAAVAVAKKKEAEQLLSDQWTALQSSIPQMSREVEGHIHALAKGKHPRKGVDIAVAKSDLAEATVAWGAAQATFKSGDVGKAVASARDVQLKLDAAASALKLPPRQPGH